MWQILRKKAEMPTADRALPGRAKAASPCQRAFRQRQPHPGAVPGRPRAGDVRAGLLLGRRAQVLAGAGRLCDRRRLRRRPHAEPDLRGGLLGHDRPQRGGAGRVRPEEDSLRELLKVFWESHDPTQGMRQGNDVGTQYRSGIYTFSPSSSKAAEASRDAVPEGARRSTATARSRPRSSTRRSSTTPRTITSSTSPRTPAAIAASAAPA